MCVCVCVHSISAGSLATNRQIRRALVYVLYLLLAALFISLFMAIPVFMIVFSRPLTYVSDCRFYIYVVYTFAPHMVSLSLCIYACMSMNSSWFCLALLLDGLLMVLFDPCEFVSVWVFFSRITFCQSFVVVIKL